MFNCLGAGTPYIGMPRYERPRFERPSVIDGKDFNPDELRGNEVNIGTINHYVTWAKIPQLPGRICRKTNENGTPYIELIIKRIYDKEKQENRNRKVSIGADISDFYRGMMIPNDAYYLYFDHDGHPKYSENFPEILQDDKEAELIKKRPVTTEEPEMTEATDTQTAEETEEMAAEATKETQTAGETPTTTQTAETATIRTTAPAVPAAPVLTPEQEAEIIQRDLETRRKIQENKREEDRIQFMKSLLQLYQYSITTIAEKKPDTPLSDYQIRRINMLLREIQEFFRDCENSEYLQLADEACMTYGDMAILLSPYNHFFSALLFGRLWYR